MNKETSTYLDCARFLAAFTVMLCHIDEFVVKGVTPFADHLGIEAVGLFFVLSGFVIGYATEFREKDLRTYAINRAARLYSVVIPCLMATLILDTIGIHFVYTVWYHRIRFIHEVQHIALGFTFLSYSWLLPRPIQPGTDGPFWSLCYEVPYYVMFGAIWFLRGFRRWLVLVLTLLLFGPAVLKYFPLWLLGLAIYYLSKSISLKPLLARGIVVLAILLWVGFEALLKYFGICSSIAADIAAGPILLYGSGICFAVSVVGFQFSGLSLRAIAAPARWLAGATFTLYLLHFPLIWLLNGVMLASPIATWPPHLRWALIVVVTFSLVLAVAQVTERRKNVWRRGIEQIFAAAERVFGATPAPQMQNEKQPLL